jgi:hypothetical protein
MDNENNADADGKRCCNQPWTDADYKQPEAYQPGGGKMGKGKASSAKEETDEGEGY